MSEPIIASRQPFAVAALAGGINGRCASGWYARQPCCDGPQQRTWLTPVKP
jgi:hypothetical protein